MTSFKLTVSDTKGKSLTKELKDAEATPLLGLEVGAEADATIVGFEGKIKITGGSDKSGVPMRQDVHGGARKYVLLSPGVGLNKAETGTRKRKLVRGNQITEEMYQINCRFDGIIPETKKKKNPKRPQKRNQKKNPKQNPKRHQKRKQKKNLKRKKNNLNIRVRAYAY